MSPVGTIFVPFPPKTGTNMLHPLPHPIVELVAGIILSTGEIVRRGLQYELITATMLISAAVSFCLVLKEVKLLLLRPTRHTSALLFHRVMSVSDGEARSRVILVFFGLDPAPPSFRHARPPKRF